MFNQYPDIMTVAEACETLQMSRNTLYELLRDGQINYTNKPIAICNRQPIA